MKSDVKIRQTSIAAIAQMLDEAAVRAADSLIFMRLLRLKDQALQCRARSLTTLRTDRKLRAELPMLFGAVASGDPAEILPVLEKIETLLFERERPRRMPKQSALVQGKRELFAQLRVHAMQIDLWTSRKQALIRTGIALDGAAGQINRAEFEACSDRLQTALNNFRQTLNALKAMDSVLLMQSEEATLRRLEELYRTYLPDPEVFEDRVLRTEVRRDLLDEKTNRIISAKKFSDTRDNPVSAPLYQSESSQATDNHLRSESCNDHHQEFYRHRAEVPSA